MWELYCARKAEVGHLAAQAELLGVPEHLEKTNGGLICCLANGFNSGMFDVMFFTGDELLPALTHPQIVEALAKSQQKTEFTNMMGHPMGLFKHASEMKASELRQRLHDMRVERLGVDKVGGQALPLLGMDRVGSTPGVFVKPMSVVRSF